ncbi:electron transfer flavoprotein alpha-subunit [Metarhizium album ARSEF 1941]|uniref:Electron transfer flavoprotein alpha-subunit n=1 Tax=Metarhizium album (strain ARSEF 1941) TaxID=1081103 RepID=A0A0B2WYC4_METAS|nr:electron transfer flavoprotein alpha-subunit [Metarhizium album ARSEF 1941]KHN98427.1 electron transfer flavoprotein alpha-subunit [Metarhizium album ARSEF 1941]
MAPSKEVAVVGSNALTSIDPDQVCTSPATQSPRPVCHIGTSQNANRSVQTLKASKALLAHIKKAAKETSDKATKRNLYQDDDDDDGDTPVWLTLTTKRHIADKARLQPGKIPVPHSLNTDENSTICAITADPQRAYKNIIGSDEFPAELSKRITRVIDFGKLKAKYGQYEAQRKLFSEHDIFLADDRIINRLPKVLGKTFYKTTAKRPIPVVFSAKRPKVDGKRAKRQKTNKDDKSHINAGTAAEIAKEIQKALGSALVSLSPTTNTAVRIGYANWTPEQIADNVDAVVTGLVGKWVPQKWRNVRSIYIKGPDTAALPIWLTDELWVDDKDVVADQEAEATGAEKANVGKKRKSLDAGAEPESAAPKKRAKKQDRLNAESNDDKLDKQITERKARLKKQKAAAKKAMDD